MKSSENRLLGLYALAFITVTTTAIVGQIVIQRSLGRATAATNLINLAGTQRMLSEQIAKDVLRVQHSKVRSADLQQLADTRQSLRGSIAQLRATRRAMQYGDVDLRIQAVRSPAVLNLMKELNPVYDRFVELAEPFAASPGDAPSLQSERQGSAGTLLQQQAKLLPLLNELADCLNVQARGHMQWSRYIEWSLQLLILAILVLKGWLVFRPAVCEVRRTIALLQERERKLRQSERRYRDLVQYSEVPILCLHPETGRVTDVNPAAARGLGKSPDDLLGRRFQSLIEPVSLERFEDCLYELREQHESQCKLRIRTTSGNARIWLARFTIYLTDENLRYVLLNAHDITAQPWLRLPAAVTAQPWLRLPAAVTEQRAIPPTVTEPEHDVC